MKALIAVLALAACACAADLGAIRAESNLEKRAGRALENADQSLDAAVDAVRADRAEQLKSALDEVVASVHLAQESLKETGKDPRRHSKYFKKAELSLRKLLRRLKDLETSVSVADRQGLLEAEQKVQEVHDAILNGIMTKNP